MPDAPTIAVDGQDVSEAIRGTAVTDAVSPVAAVPEVRSRLVELQRAGGAPRPSAGGRGIVVEGRDIGSVVLPDATAKIYLTADAGARAARRALEDAGRTGDGAPAQGDLEATAASLAERDRIDSSRAVSPLVMADGAVHVDGTYLTLEEVIDAIVGIVRGGRRPAALARPAGGPDSRGRGLPLLGAAASDGHDVLVRMGGLSGCGPAAARAAGSLDRRDSEPRRGRSDRSRSRR